MRQSTPVVGGDDLGLPTKEERSELNSQVAALVPQLALARAMALARVGEYSAAESLLDNLVKDHQVSVAALDLLARIHAQNGRSREAEETWKQILRIDPAHRDSLAGIHRLSAKRRWPFWLPFALLLVACIIVFGSLAGTVFYISHSFRRLQDSLHSQIAEVMARNPPVNRGAPAQSLQTLPDIRIPGVQTRKVTNGIEIVFDDGLFLQGTKFRPNAVSDLSRVAEQVRTSRESLSLIIAGATDNLPVRTGSRYSDNLALGLARAQSVYRQMKKAGLDADSMSLKSLSIAPFPNDSAGNPDRNRTVTIFISLHEK